MSDPVKQAWSDVADELGALGGVLKDRVQGRASGDTGGGNRPDAGAALREAFEQVREAARDINDRTIGAVRDDVVADHVKQAARALTEAVSATLETIGQQIGGLFTSSRPTSADPGDEMSAVIAAGGEVVDVTDDGDPEVVGPNSA
jgi:hypothetical protein